MSLQKITGLNTEHKMMIHDSQYDFYGNKLATCSSDGIIKVFDTSKPDNIQTLASFQAHDGPAWQISWAHPRFGNIIASCGYDCKVAIWKEIKLNDWRLVIEYNIHEASVSWAPEETGLWLAACSSDGKVSTILRQDNDIWREVQTVEAHDKGVTSISWEPSSQNFEQKKPRFVTGGLDFCIKIWQYELVCSNFMLKMSVKAHLDWVRDVSWNTFIGNEHTLIASCSEDQNIYLWKLDQQTLEILEKIQLKLQNDKDFTGPIWRVSWNPAGNMLAASYVDENDRPMTCIYEQNVQGEWINMGNADDGLNNF